MKKKLWIWVPFFIFLSTYSYQDKKSYNEGFFSIKEIEIQGIKYANLKDLKNTLNYIKNKNLIFLKTQDFSEALKKIDFVNSIKIKKMYPNKIIITVLEDAPIGIYFDDSEKKYILLENNKIIKNSSNEFDSLPEVKGKGALENYSNFYSNLQKTKLDLNLVKKFNYHYVNRWDILLVNEKLIKLPPENYEESVAKFLEIYEKSSFEKFKVFDFRVKNELILR